MANEDGSATTAEKASAYLAALEEEKASYETRVQRVKDGGSDSMSGDELAALVKACEAEIKRVKPAAKKADGEA